MISLVLGGARSGKSRFAEKLADNWLNANPEGKRFYIATAQIFDDEMKNRIKLHQEQREKDWHTVEAPFNPSVFLEQYSHPNAIILLDCITLWLSNLLLRGDDVEGAVEEFINTLMDNQAKLIFVSNEVGLGIVPDNKLGRHFRDIQGLTNQKLAATADEVYFIAAGLPLKMKG